MAEEEDELTKIAVIGRPNVGKSSLVNRLLGFERSVANPVAGTTRDSVDTLFTCNKKRYLLIDTAGIRSKGKVSLKIETYSVVDALRSIERADVVLIVINAEEGVTEQDTKIAGYAYEAGRSCLFVVNKWDTVAKDNASMGKFVEKYPHGLQVPGVCADCLCLGEERPANRKNNGRSRRPDGAVYQKGFHC